MGIKLTSGDRGSVSVKLGEAALAARYAQEAKAASESARQACMHPPVIGGNGNWQIWRQGSGYTDSGVHAEGPAGLTGPQGPKGDRGDPGDYTKPGGGIPKSDLASDVQTSLGKADTALQEHQSLTPYRTAADQDTVDAGKAPTNHASAETAYGLGTGGSYGHVKLSDAANGTADASGGTASTPKATAKAYDLASRPFVGKTASGASVTFDAPAAGLPIRDMTVGIVPAQSGSGTPSPTNVRPVSGWDAAHIYHSATDGTDTETADKTVPFPTTVYRGTLDPITGELTVDMAVIDLGDITWTTQTIGSVSAFQGDFGSDNIRGDKAADDSYLCTCYRFINDARQTLETVNYAFTPQNKANSYKLALRDDRYSTAAALKAAVTGQKLVYQLKNPVVYQLSPVEITTLLGENSINADCGGVSVTYEAYLAAVNDHVDRVNASLLKLMTCIAPIENGATASQAYAQGAYFFHNGDFCKAKTAISSGAAFTLNTNYQITTVSAAIVALQS